ncbi:protein of unknown function [Magnetospirillum sp. XM-1]|uniref:hypothetical protein n=1 Tax=Magnetospirillum sp. XM-1 TaxID=1663591 RepID=UPI00073DDD2C|nr:hypothetical protein [Magnetospirillum sp. XM-1]CUW40857.1 protein of unknown function [Magnetospirillum sp. XM-1]
MRIVHTDSFNAQEIEARFADAPKLDAPTMARDYIHKMNELAKLAGVSPRKAEKHPIYEHLDVLEAMFTQGEAANGLRPVGRFGPDPQSIIRKLEEQLAAASHFGYDNLYWLNDALYNELCSDAENLKFIRSRLPRPELFEATIAEISYWGWLRQRGLAPKLSQAEGQPDILVGVDKQDAPIYCDVKALLPGTKPSRVEEVISKANSQLKVAGGDGVKGYCVLKVVPGSAYADIDVVRAYEREATRVMRSKHCRSVNFVLLVWEAMEVKGNIPGWLTVVGTRRTTKVSHAAPRANVRLVGDLEPAATIKFDLYLAPQD